MKRTNFDELRNKITIFSILFKFYTQVLILSKSALKIFDLKKTISNFRKKYNFIYKSSYIYSTKSMKMHELGRIHT